MSLVSGVRALAARHIGDSTRLSSELARSLLWAGFLTLLVAGPWLLPGYLFGTDWPGPRRFPFPTVLVSSAPLDAVLALASSAIGGEATGKLVFAGSLFIAAALAYRAAPARTFLPRALAATVYTVNPFVYGRLHYGQLYLVLGYALLPWVAIRLRALLLNANVRTATLAAVSFVLIATASTHLFLMSCVLAGILFLAYFTLAEERFAYLKRAAPYLVLTVALTVAGTSYWLSQILTGRGPESARLAGIGTGDLNAFAAIPDLHLGLLPNLLGLYGFWAENTGRFTSMKAFAPFWPSVLAAVLGICTIGAIASFRQRSRELAPWVAGLLVMSVVCLVLEMGVSHPLTSGLVTWLDIHAPLYRGLRDAGKWGALIALVYSQLCALGAVAILAWLKRAVRNPVKAEWAGGVAAGLLLALPLYYGNGLLFGAHGEIKPSQYPPGWYSADRVLTSDAHPGRTLFLPWHEYMRYTFVQNQNSVVVSPAPTFFSVPVIVSVDPEVPGIAPPGTPDQVAVAALVQEGSKGRWAEVLRSLDVRYVLVAKELDWQTYSYLDTQPSLTRVADFGQILLFRNNLVSPLRGLNQTNLYVQLTVRPVDAYMSLGAPLRTRYGWLIPAGVRPGCLRTLSCRSRFSLFRRSQGA
jgi:hypothetical protein